MTSLSQKSAIWKLVPLSTYTCSSRKQSACRIWMQGPPRLHHTGPGRARCSSCRAYCTGGRDITGKQHVHMYLCRCKQVSVAGNSLLPYRKKCARVTEGHALSRMHSTSTASSPEI
eukprot:1160268-Pelagomonas_calceolata.AAC.3